MSASLVLVGVNGISASKTGIYCPEFAQRMDLIVCKGPILTQNPFSEQNCAWNIMAMCYTKDVLTPKLVPYFQKCWARLAPGEDMPLSFENKFLCVCVEVFPWQ